MKIAARPLIVMHGNADFRERLRALSGKDYTFRAVPDWSALAEAVREAPASAVIVVDPYAEAPRGSGISRALRSLLGEFPSIPVFAALEVSADSAEDLVALGKAGVVDVIAIEHDDTREALRERLRRAQGRPLKLLLDQVLPPEMPGRARAILDAGAEVVSVGGHGSDLARVLGMSRRTLLRWSERSTLPPPRRLLAWMRILLAAELLDDPGRRVLDVATACGYSSDSGLRRVTMKFLGASPSRMRRRGAFAFASRAFLAALERHRGMTEAEVPPGGGHEDDPPRAPAERLRERPPGPGEPPPVRDLSRLRRLIPLSP